MDARNREVRDWIAKVRASEIALPRFQRFEAWDYGLVEDVLTNVIRDLPIGSTLVLGVGNEVPFICRNIVGAPPLEKQRPSELLLDGQQRVTALFRSLYDNYQDRTYFVELPLAEERKVGWSGGGYTLIAKVYDFEIYEREGSFSVEQLPRRYEVVSGLSSLDNAKRWIEESRESLALDEDKKKATVISEARRYKNDKRYPLWADIPEQCWERRVIPLRLLNPDDESEYRKWAEAAAAGDSKVQLNIERIISALREKVAHFKLPYLYLDPVPDTPRNVAINVFVKLNTSYVKLSAYDIVVAQFEEKIGQSLHDLVASLKGRVPQIVHYYEDPSELVLAAAALLQNSPPSERTFLESLKPGKMVEDWSKIVDGCKETVEFLASECVLDRDRMPTEPIIASLVALWSQAPTDPDARGNVRRLLRKYMWRAFFTTRYDHSVNSVTMQDYRKLREVISGAASESQVPCFDDKYYSLPDKEALKNARWPKYRDRLGRALLLMTFRGGAQDIADGAPISVNNIKNREYHHLYPVSTFDDSDEGRGQANLALNCILVTWRTNRKISAKEPIAYLLERCEASKLGEAEIRRRLKTHFVDFDLLASGDYEKFLDKRAEKSEAAINNLCAGNFWTPL
jgi:hypothetical protein